MKTDEIIAKVRTFEDACEVLGIAVPEGLPEILQPKNAGIVPPHIVAMTKLEMITAALNQGWTWIPDGETKGWWPWFWFFTQEEIDKMDDEEKKYRCIVPAGEFSKFAGLGYAISGYAWSSSSANFGSRLAYRNAELAKHSGRQFIELWRQWLFK